MSDAVLEAVCVGRPAPVPYRGNLVMTAIGKRPVSGRVAVRGVNLDGDDQADRKLHGGPDKAVYAYAREDSEWWADELGRDRERHPAGVFGENLATRGYALSAAVIGERWRVGSVLLEVCQPRTPCFKLATTLGIQAKPFVLASRPGAYLRIVEEGELGAGDALEVVERPDHGVTVALVADAQRDRSLRARLRDAPELAEPWAGWAAGRFEA